MVKFIIMLAIAGFILSVVFVSWMYFGFKPTVTDVSYLKPYSDIVGKELITKRDAIIANNYIHHINENPYIIEEDENNVFDEAKPRYTLPAGTKLYISAAKHFKNATSGFIHSYVLGTVQIAELNQQVAFEYSWGEKPFIPYDGNGELQEKEYWKFPLALWQDKAIEEKVYLD